MPLTMAYVSYIPPWVELVVIYYKYIILIRFSLYAYYESNSLKNLTSNKKKYIYLERIVARIWQLQYTLALVSGVSSA